VRALQRGLLAAALLLGRVLAAAPASEPAFRSWEEAFRSVLPEVELPEKMGAQDPLDNAVVLETAEAVYAVAMDGYGVDGASDHMTLWRFHRKKAAWTRLVLNTKWGTRWSVAPGPGGLLITFENALAPNKAWVSADLSKVNFFPAQRLWPLPDGTMAVHAPSSVAMLCELSLRAVDAGKDACLANLGSSVFKGLSAASARGLRLRTAWVCHQPFGDLSAMIAHPEGRRPSAPAASEPSRSKGTMRA
jgi:hypothetical protein